MIIEANTSVSHGTMRNADLLYTFGMLLSSVATAETPSAKTDKHNALAREAVQLWDCNCADTESGSEVIAELFDALNEYAPDGCYFGAHPGDGSDYGFWTNEND